MRVASEGTNGPAGDLDDPDRSAGDLDDTADREELRQRYYGLLQELRVLLPGVQVLVAFLLTAPFASRFGELDAASEVAYAISLLAGSLAVVAFVTPAAFHRYGGQTARAERLTWGIRATRLGIASMAVSLEAAVLVVLRLVFGTAVAVACAVALGAAMVLAWTVLPLSVGRDATRHQGSDADRTAQS